MTVWKNIILILFMAFLLSCAKEGFPPGGPEDKTPPEVVRTIPESGNTMVDSETSVQVWFSEGIDSRSAADAVFITPFFDEEDRKINVRGRKISISFTESLDSNRTYVITLGTGIKDYRSNPLEVS
jgi:hypothetical protein